MRHAVLFSILLPAIVTLTGCSHLTKAVTTAGGAAAGGFIAKEMSDGSTSAIILGSAIGAGVGALGGEMLDDHAAKKEAQEKAEIWEDGRRYEREAAAQQAWYNATLMPDLPQKRGTVRDTPRQVTVIAPGETVGGMRLAPRATKEEVLP